MHVTYRSVSSDEYLAEFNRFGSDVIQVHIARSDDRYYPDLPGESDNRELYSAVADILRRGTAPMSVLDNGCGTGYGVEILAATAPREYSHNVLGVDCDRAAIDYAALRHPTGSYICTTTENLRFQAGYFDVVVDIEGLEATSDPALVLRNCHRMMIDAGLLFIAIKNPNTTEILGLLEDTGFGVVHELVNTESLFFVGCVKCKSAEDLHDFWREQATDVARHHIDGLDEWADVVDHRLIDHIVDDGATSVMEWGCGQGDISLRLARRVENLHLVDILDESLSRATATLAQHGHAPASTARVTSAAAAELPVDTVDALLCTAVVQHFPSLEYWREMAALWRSLEPRVIVLQTRHGDENRETNNYQTEYFTALWLETQEVLDQFPDYELVEHHCDDGVSDREAWWAAETKYEYFVFKKRA